MARFGYLTPDTGDGATVARCLSVPVELQPIVNGALETLCDYWNWEQFGTMTIEDAITALRAAIDAYYESECVPVYDFPNTETQLWRQGRVKSGNDLSFVLSSSQVLNGYWLQNAPAIHDAVEFAFWLAKGVYVAYMFGVTNNQSGIMSFDVNGVSQGVTIDWYSAGGVFSVEKSVNLTLPTDGLNLIRVKIDTKNASSTNYFARMSYMMLKWLSAA